MLVLLDVDVVLEAIEEVVVVFDVEEDVVVLLEELDVDFLDEDVVVDLLLLDEEDVDLIVETAFASALPRADVHDSALAVPAFIVSDPNTSAPASATLVIFLSLLVFATCTLPFPCGFRNTQIHRGNPPAAPADHSLR